MTDHHNPQQVKRMLYWASLLVLITVITIFLGRLPGCSVEPQSNAVNPPDKTCEGEPLGSTREEVCDGGKIVSVCTVDGYKEAVRTCRAPEQCGVASTSFTAVQPILTRNCAGACHRGKDTFENAKTNAVDFMRRINLDVSNPQHMPRGGDLTASEKSSFQDWIDDGLCPPPTQPVPEFKSLDYLEQRLLEDLTAVEPSDRENMRYLVSLHRMNANAPQTEVEAYKQAAGKVTNSLSVDRELHPVVEVSPGIYRFDLEALDLDAQDWLLIEGADKLDIESFTSRGQLLKLLSGTKKPWYHVDNFTDTSLRNSAVYYALTDTPATFQEMVDQLGVDFADDLNANKADAALAAFVGSPLSPHNRMVSHHDSDNGSLWTTFDTGALDAREKNYFEFPLLLEVGGKLNGQFVGGESIYSLPNGLQAYVIFNAKQVVVEGKVVGSQLDKVIAAAPIDVVRDFLNPVNAEIRAGVSCFRCHSGGVLPFSDQLRQHIIDNGSQFGADKDLALALYKGNNEMQSLRDSENLRYAAALRALGIDPQAQDPITVAQDRLLTSWDLATVANFVFISPSDFALLLNQSADAKAQIGQLLSGGTITYDQFVLSLPVLKRDLRLFQDPL